MGIPYSITKQFVLLWFICFGCFALALFSGVQAETYDNAIIVRIIDGDTLKINYKGNEESVRLIGVDTPESKANKKAQKDAERTGQDISTITAMGKASANFTRGLAKPGDAVRVEFDVQPKDKYGRLLAYIYLANGKMLNEELVKAGYATIMTYPPNVKYQERFLKAYREARESRKGLWE
ncbi:thermonuclease [Candidatus Kuenenia stuttgartiensis]|uniref:Thermonuclease n=1 Tax=Kuenenia stuttgartiensis TaxID=174633 RepID=A0A6G7GKR3_KUEST|nr:thermonuclease family protein [Candidatus Kuenenia stuttgartiensis]QII10011.1 thermonuclease [Candidatus Kuenenia stuttgartiensis]